MKEKSPDGNRDRRTLEESLYPLKLLEQIDRVVNFLPLSVLNLVITDISQVDE